MYSGKCLPAEEGEKNVQEAVEIRYEGSRDGDAAAVRGDAGSGSRGRPVHAVLDYERNAGFRGLDSAGRRDPDPDAGLRGIDSGDGGYDAGHDNPELQGQPAWKPRLSDEYAAGHHTVPGAQQVTERAHLDCAGRCRISCVRNHSASVHHEEAGLGRIFPNDE